MSMKYTILVIWVISAVACAGGAETTSTTRQPGTTAPTVVTIQAEAVALELARDQWLAVERSWYRYTYQRFCECDFEASGPNEVLVVGGEVTEVWYDGPVDVEKPLLLDTSFGWTVSDLFEMIRQSLEQGHEIHVTYHDSGYPERLSLDVEALAWDGGFSLEIIAYHDPVTDQAHLDAVGSTG